jgi:hypothetical protein
MTMRKALLPFLLLAACQPTGYLTRPDSCPEGFVPVDTLGGDFRGRAISSDGVVIAIRERTNEPGGSLDFWSAVVKKELVENQGYAVRSEKALGGGQAILFLAPRERTTAYYVALFVTPRRIVTVEVAGPEREVERDLPGLEEYIAKLTFG